MSLVLFRSLLTIHLEHVLQHVLCLVDSILIIFNTSNREDSYAHFTGRKLGLEATELNDLPQVTILSPLSKLHSRLDSLLVNQWTPRKIKNF